MTQHSKQRELRCSVSERPVNDTQLFLVSARKCRGADHRDKDDYDVRLGDASGAVVGRIVRLMMPLFLGRGGTADLSPRINLFLWLVWYRL